ncbi:MAG: hypothetical protein Q9227_004228 [Pyrenula ochraceoflavens]
MSAPEKVSVALLSDEDIPTCFQIFSKSFSQGAPFLDAYFPNHNTPLGQAQGSQRLTAWKKTSKDSTFLKAVLNDNDLKEQQKIVGFAIWTYMKEPPPMDLEDAEENVEEIWPDEEGREFTRRLWRGYVAPRAQAVRDSEGKGVYVLEILAVHPDYQRLGAGKALVKWGTQAADEKGVQSVLESTPVARKLYEQCGLQTQIEEMHFDVGERFSDRRLPELAFMKRELKS